MVLYPFWYSNDNCVNFCSSTTIQRNGGVDSIKVKRAQAEIDRNSIFIRILTSLKAITWYHLKHSTMFASRSHTHTNTPIHVYVTRNPIFIQPNTCVHHRIKETAVGKKRRRWSSVSRSIKISKSSNSNTKQAIPTPYNASLYTYIQSNTFSSFSCHILRCSCIYETYRNNSVKRCQHRESDSFFFGYCCLLPLLWHGITIVMIEVNKFFLTKSTESMYSNGTVWKMDLIWFRCGSISQGKQK